MVLTPTQGCSEHISGGSFRGHRCSHNAVMVEDGKPYCRIHSPSYVAAKRAKSQAKWQANFDAKWTAERERSRQQEVEKAWVQAQVALFPKLVAQLKILEADFEMGDCPSSDLLVMVRALLADRSGLKAILVQAEAIMPKPVVSAAEGEVKE